MIELASALAAAVTAARECGAVLRDDFHRSHGPRGAGDKADADTEGERLIRARLLEAFPEWGYLGEETGAVPGREGAPLWLVDPNDGTRDYLKGRRGSAVSIALLVDRVPRLGVVFAFAYPDDDGDLFCWAEGCGPLRRNGRALAVELRAALGVDDVVVVSSAGDRDPAGYTRCCEPARFRCVPSIAHRLALAAAGEAAAAVSLHGPGAWDYGGGHALLRSVGGALVDERGRPVEYGTDGRSQSRYAFGGAREIVIPLARQPWPAFAMTRRGPKDFPVRLCPGEALRDSATLARAQGCLLGLLAGARVAGNWEALQYLSLARTIVAAGRFDPARVREAESRAAHPRTASVGQWAARGAVIGMLGWRLEAGAVADLARADASSAGVDPAWGDAAGAVAVAVAVALRGGAAARDVRAAARDWAVGAGGSSRVVRTLTSLDDPGAADLPADDDGLRRAFAETARTASLEDGIAAVTGVRTAALAGALLGALRGREAVPPAWRSWLLSSRTDDAFGGAPPIDALAIAERLLLAGLALAPAEA